MRCVCSLLVVAAALPAADIHVSPGGTGDGFDWASAMGDLTQAMAQAGAGDRVLLDSGSFTVDDDLVVPSGVSLIGQGAEGAERTVVTGSWSAGGQFPPGNSVIRLKDASDVLIEDLAIDGQDDRLPGGIYAIDCQRVTIRGVHVLDTGFVGIWLHGGSHYEIDDCLLHNCGWESNAYSSGLLSLGGISDSRIHHTRIYGWDDNDGYGVKSMGAGNWLRRVTFDHLDIDVKPRAMWNGGSANFTMELAHSAFAEEVRILDCTLNMGLSLVGHDEYTGDSFSFELARNYLDVHSGRWIELTTSRMHIHHNYFTGAHSGHPTFNTYNPELDQGGIVIHHNIFEYAQGELFGLQGSNGIVFCNNTVIWAPHQDSRRTPYLARFRHDNSSQTWVVKNNLFLSPDDRTGELFRVNDGAAPPATEVSHNFAPYFDFDGIIAEESHGLPLDGGKPDPWWRLSADSPLVDAGVAVAGVTDDAVDAPDIGAWEVGGDNRFLPDDFQWPVLPAVNEPVQPGLDWAAYDFEDDNDKMIKDVRGVLDLTPDATGSSSTYDNLLVFEVDEEGDRAAIVFTGYLQAPETGLYRFWLESHNGSRLQINGIDVLENDSWHSRLTVSDVVRLEAGLHPIRIYFAAWWGSPQAIALDWRVPGGERTAVPAAALFRDDPAGTLTTRRVGITVRDAGPWQLLVGDDEPIDASDGEQVESAGHDPARDLLFRFAPATGGLSADG